jgi:hypothetical protein
MNDKCTEKVLNSDDFEKMSLEAQNAYMHLILVAEEDGFVDRPKLINANISEENLNILLENYYAVRYEDGILLITNWIIHEIIKAQGNER